MSKSREFVLGVAGGKISMIYDDDLTTALRRNLGGTTVHIRRASHVEARPDGSEFYADMAPVNGPVLTGFPTRSAALSAEVDYMNRNVVLNPNSFTPTLP